MVSIRFCRLWPCVRSRFDWPSTQPLTSPFYEPRRSNDQSVHYSRSPRTILGIFEESEKESEIHCSTRTFQTLKSKVRCRYSRKPAKPLFAPKTARWEGSKLEVLGYFRELRARWSRNRFADGTGKDSWISDGHFYFMHSRETGLL